MEKRKTLEAAKKIIDLDREELSLSHPYLTPALYTPVLSGSSGNIRGSGVDPAEDIYYYDPDGLISDFLSEKNTAISFLHSVLHCVFLHPFSARNRADSDLWDLSSDICIWDIIYSLGISPVPDKAEMERKAFISRLRKELPVLNAEGIYSYLERKPADPEVFRFDDHSLWYSKTADSREFQGNLRKWRRIAGEIELSLLRSLKNKDLRGDTAGDFLERLKDIQRKRFDYEEFLKIFGAAEEVIRIDPDFFDQAFYAYGMELYGDMPLIEPLEYSEKNTVKEFVIAIDTSLSCSMDLIRRFLERTYDILFASTAIGEQKKLLILQCDAEIQNETVIRSRKDLEDYMSEVSVRGRGGTDFRPVFRRIRELEKENALTRLRGLLYFTDGDGVFPETPPKYKTAFVMPGGTVRKVPAWAESVRFAF